MAWLSLSESLELQVGERPTSAYTFDDSGVCASIIASLLPFMSISSLVVRSMRTDEGRAYLDIHGRSIRGLAATHYPPEVIEGWAGRITDGYISWLMGNPDGELRWLAELNGELVGLGALVIPKSELRACYVVPEAARKGVGTALVTEMERAAREHGLTMLRLDSSTNAEPFYVALGYEVVERYERVLGSGVRMAAVKMRKMLGNAQDAIR